MRTRAIDLEEEAKATKAKMARLEERATDREVQLGRVETELIQQAEKFKVELIQQAEEFKKAEAELLEDAVNAFASGFEGALEQVACAYPEIDVSYFATSKRVVEGQIVPQTPPS